MTYQQIKNKIVDENKLMDNKQFKKFILKYSFGLLGLILSFCTASAILLGAAAAMLLGIICVYAYGVILDYIVEDLDKLGSAQKWVSFWWLSYIIMGVIFFALKYFRFI